MRRLIRHMLSRPVTVAMACIAVAGAGVFALSRLPIDLAPRMDLPRLAVRTGWPEAAAEHVERIITAPVEEIVSGVKGVRSVRSTSREGHSRVDVEFDQRTDIGLARLELNERLSAFRPALPAGAARPVVEQYLPREIEQLQGFLSYSLTGPLSRSGLDRIARETVIPGLLAVDGVAQVHLEEAEEQELLVELDPEKLAAFDVTAQDVWAALENWRPNSIKVLPELQTIEGPQTHDELQAIRELPVKQHEGTPPIRLRGLGTAEVTARAPRELTRINGKEAVTLVISRQPLSGLTGTARRVRTCVADLARDLPPGVELFLQMDRSKELAAEFQALSHDAVISLLLLWLVLVLFLGTGRAPLVLVTSVLLSLAGTLVLLWMLRIPLHLLTLAGLVLGMGRLLDDSIVVLENLRRWCGADNAVDSIVGGTHEVLLAVTASTAATVGALLPVTFLPRELQAYLLEFSVAVAVSLLMSLLCCFTVIPTAMCRWRMQGTGLMVRSGGSTAWLYQHALQAALRHRGLVLLAAAWMFGIPVWLLPAQIDGSSFPILMYNATIGGKWYTAIRPTTDAILGGASYQFFRNVPRSEFLGPGPETYLVMQGSFPQGTDLAGADTLARLLERRLLHAGAPRVTTRVAEGGFLIRIDFPDSLQLTPLPQTFRNSCVRLAAQVAGAAVSVIGFGAAFSGGMDLQPGFTVRVRGYDYDRVKQIAESLREKLLQNPRVTSVGIDQAFGRWSRMQEVALDLDRRAMARYGVTARDVDEAVRSRLDRLSRDAPVEVRGTRLPVIVSVKGSQHFSVEDLSATPASGGSASTPVPLGSLLKARLRPAPSEILREEQQYVRWVSFEYKGPYRHAEAFLASTLRALPLPDGYTLDRPDSFAVTGKEWEALLLAVCAAILVVFMVTASLYESLFDPFVIMLSIPLAYIGVFVAFVLAGAPFGRGGYLSVILLTGIAVANAIVIVDFIVRKEREEGRSMEVLVNACVCRLRPVLMTTLTTAGGLIPMLLEDQRSLWYTLALGTLGGLSSSALLMLFVVPAAYLILSELTLNPSPGKRGEQSG